MYLQLNQSKWHACTDHDPKQCSEAVNCYAYILNNPNYFWAVPGLGFVKSTPQKFFDDFNDHFRSVSSLDFRNALMEGAVSDGLVKIQKPKARSGYYLAALVFADSDDDFDFHWYRQDDDGSWSHKNGWGPVTNKDDTGTVITDPQVAFSYDYPAFGSFYLVPQEGVVLSGNLTNR